jgi:hypothetical protein
MMKRTVLLVSLLLCCQITLAGTYSGGTGIEPTPYIISTTADWLELIATPADFNSSFILANDLDLTAQSTLAPVADYTAPFTGKFDGRNHTITIGTMDYPSTNFIALFADVLNAQIKNINVNCTSINGQSHVGILIGRLTDSQIINCNVSGKLIGTWSDVGGIAGSATSSTITHCTSAANINTADAYRTGSLIGNSSSLVEYCSATGTVNADSSSGGLVGQNSSPGIIRYCSATGSVTVSSSYAGGLVGENRYQIYDSYAHGNVSSGRDGAGGIAGALYDSSSTINNCYSTGTAVADRYYAGPLVGRNRGAITNSFWDSQTSGYAGGMTTAQMKTRSTFTSAGWDFLDDTNGSQDNWRMCINGVQYPRLAWQFTPGDITCYDGVDILDFSVIAENWLTDSDDPGFYENADIDNSGKIDPNDINQLAKYWLTTP